MVGARRSRRSAARLGRGLVVLAVAAPATALAAGCSAVTGAGSGIVHGVGAENQYADVLSQVGGRYVSVSSILDDPNTDPHSFESSPSVARQVGGAELIVQNGAGYDDFMQKIESASPSPDRRVLVVQRLLGLPGTTPNPHLWYVPTTMPVVAAAIAEALSALEPAHGAYFRANAQAFDTSLRPWLDAIAAFEARFPGVRVATTEPVADGLLQAMGAHNLTPLRFQTDIMNGVDPSPQDISLVNGLLAGHQVKVFCYNQQVTSSLTASIRHDAVQAGVPVVGVYETMPTPGYHYQRWMLAEVQAISEAVAEHVSTEHL